MFKETGLEEHIALSLDDLKDMEYDDIHNRFIDYAIEHNKVPCDFNYAGRPNIYLRGKYNIIDGKKIFSENVMIMFVKDK